MPVQFRCAAILCAVLVPLHSAFATDVPGWGLEPLMARLHRVKSASAGFVERKYLHVLTQPLETSGTLKYVAPDRLERVAAGSTPDSMVLQGETLTGTQNGRAYSIRLGNHPEIAAMVEGIRSTMAGDLPTLRAYYSVGLSGGADKWQLTLTPLEASVRGKIGRILIDGAQASLTSIEVDEADGDRSEMLITPIGP